MDIQVNDGTTIHVEVSGEGRPLVFLAGGGLSCEVFKAQIEVFSKHFRVIQVDMRATGRSERVSHGLRISRLAMDLNQVLNALEIEKTDVLAHSMGCSVVYNFIDLFTQDRFDRLVLVDEPAALTINPFWTEKERLDFGATYDALESYSLLQNMRKGVVRGMVSPNLDEEKIQFIEKAFQMDPASAIRLYSDNLKQDWRDVIPRITCPSLVVGGKGSITPWQSQVWIHEQMPNSRLKLFEKEEGGSHFMFVENPDLFNQVAGNFLNFVFN